MAEFLSGEFSADQKIKILFATRSLSTGGGERLVSRLVNSLASDTEPIVLVMKREIAYKVGCRVYLASVGLGSGIFYRIGSIFKYAVNIRQVIRKERPDVILGSLIILSFSIFLGLSPNRIKRRSVYFPSTNPFESIHSDLSFIMKLVTIYEAVVIVLIANLGWIVFPSSYLLRKYRSFHLPLKNAGTIRYFVDPTELLALASDQPSEWPRDPVIISVGRLAPEKNHALLIRAFVKVRAAVRCKLMIVGSGELNHILHELSESLNVREDVMMLGQQENPFKFIARSKMLVLSSNFEGMPTSLIEAMTLGIPVVATDCEGCKEIIGRRNKAGIIVPRNDVAALADAILSLLQDEKLRESYATLARKRSLNFAPSHIRPSYLSLIRKVGGQRNTDDVSRLIGDFSTTPR